jgi:flagellar hook-basal body complex protein FliE
MDPIGVQSSVIGSAIEKARQAVSTEESGPSFADVFKNAINDASSLQGDAQNLIGAFLRGEPVELHQVMAASEEASISLELLVEIRNKLTEAYRSVMNIA